MCMDPVDHSAEAALHMAILHVKVAGEHLVWVTVPEHTRGTGDNGGAVFRKGCCKIDGLLRGPSLWALNSLRDAFGVDETVFQHQISNLDGGKNVRIAVIHKICPFC